MGVCRFCGRPAERNLTLTDTNTGAKVQRSICAKCGPGEQVASTLERSI